MNVSIPAVTKNIEPIVFEDFFELGLQETESPFLTPESRTWGTNLTLKASLIAAFLLVASFVLSFFSSTLPISHLLLIGVYFLAGIPSLIESIEDISSFNINIDVLMTLAAFSSVLIGSGMEGGLLLVLFSLSGSMEDSVTSKAKNAISSLHKLSPTKACVIENDGTVLERSVKDIGIGTKILIKSGQIVPLDGTVIEGISSVNLVHLTGENFPVRKMVGDQVQAGARNLEGSLTLIVTQTSADSTLARIIELVTQAQEARPKLQRTFDNLSRTYALAIIFLAAFFALFLPVILPLPYFGLEGSVYRGLAFLIASSPCALIIAIPIAYLSAISICARQGILLKGGAVLDALAGCKAIVFDKTGTLTTGDLTCLAIEPLEQDTNSNIDQALSIAYSLERNAVHPIAKALMAYGDQRKASYISLKNFKSIPGHGLEAVAQLSEGDIEVSIGHAEYIETKLPAQSADALAKTAKQIQKNGELIAVLLIGQMPYILRFRDTVRPKIKQTIQTLQKKLGLQLVMLTGDHEQSAKRIADEMGIKEYQADLKPEDKLNYVTHLSEKKPLAMVGDGINDAPALARASVGICMGKVGSTTAMDAADIILLHDNIELLDWLMKKAYQTHSIVNQNLILAVGAIFVASIPALAGLIPLWLAVLLHEGGTVLVGLNALRLLKK